MRREVRTALAQNITRQGAYHLVHYNAMAFFRLQALGALSMTDFDCGARGHAKHLLKNAGRQNSTEAKKKQTLF